MSRIKAKFQKEYFFMARQVDSIPLYLNIFCLEQSPNLVSFAKASLMCISKSVSFASFAVCITVSSLVILRVGNRGCNLNKCLIN